VRLHRRLADVDLRRDLLVRQPDATSETTSRSREVSSPSPGTGAADRVAAANSAISRRVTAGDSRPSPAAITRTAGTPLGAANFGPSRGVAGVAALPFAAAAALLAAIALSGALIAARTTVRRDIT
jgi:hypothetical protein